MTETQEKALALVNEVREGRPYTIDEAKREYGWCFQAVCRALEQHEAEKAARAAEREQHEAFRQEVSDVVEMHCDAMDMFPQDTVLGRFIIAKPDPLVEHLVKVEGYFPRVAEEVAGRLRTARGLKIVEDK